MLKSEHWSNILTSSSWFQSVPTPARTDCIVTFELSVKCHFRLLPPLFATEWRKSNSVLSGYMVLVLGHLLVRHKGYLRIKWPYKAELPDRFQRQENLSCSFWCLSNLKWGRFITLGIGKSIADEEAYLVYFVVLCLLFYFSTHGKLDGTNLQNGQLLIAFF